MKKENYSNIIDISLGNPNPVIAEINGVCYRGTKREILDFLFMIGEHPFVPEGKEDEALDWEKCLKH